MCSVDSKVIGKAMCGVDSKVIGKAMCGVDSKVMKLCVVWTVR